MCQNYLHSHTVVYKQDMQFQYSLHVCRAQPNMKYTVDSLILWSLTWITTQMVCVLFSVDVSKGKWQKRNEIQDCDQPQGVTNYLKVPSIRLACTSCSHEIEHRQNIRNVMYLEHLCSESNISIENILGLNSKYHMNDSCPSCRDDATYWLATLTSIPSIRAFGIYSVTSKIQYNLRVTVQNTNRVLNLRGIIYLGQFHFTCWLFGQDQSI